MRSLVSCPLTHPPQKITNAQIGIAKEGIAKTAFKNGILIMAL